VRTPLQLNGKPGKLGPAASRFLYSRPPLGDSTKVMRMSNSKAKPSEGTPQGPVDRGFAADYFGASPVASALNLPRERDCPENRNQTITHPPPVRSKPDISTLQGIGHFYFALTELRRSDDTFLNEFSLPIPPDPALTSLCENRAVEPLPSVAAREVADPAERRN